MKIKLFWSNENPQLKHKQLLQVPKATIWCGETSERIIGLYFFEDANGSAITVTGETYREMLREYLLPLLGELNMQNFYFQQDGVAPHTAKETMAMLRGHFLIFFFVEIPEI